MGEHQAVIDMIYKYGRV